MESDDFNSMPKDAMMIIGDMEKFVEFIAFNSVRKAVSKLMYSLFDKKTYASKLIEKYVMRYSDDLKTFARTESEKYIVKGIKLDSEEEESGSEFLEELGIVGQIKRGDIDRLVINSTNEILFKILGEMTNDKLVKLCWDPVSEDFVWMLRKPNEEDKIETQYKKTKKKSNKRQNDI